MSAQPEKARETRWVDPATLITRANVRHLATTDPELVASINAQGIMQPPRSSTPVTVRSWCCWPDTGAPRPRSRPG